MVYSYMRRVYIYKIRSKSVKDFSCLVKKWSKLRASSGRPRILRMRTGSCSSVAVDDEQKFKWTRPCSVGTYVVHCYYCAEGRGPIHGCNVWWSIEMHHRQTLQVGGTTTVSKVKFLPAFAFCKSLCWLPGVSLRCFLVSLHYCVHI